MAIGNAVERAGYVYVYDQQGKPLFNIAAGGINSGGKKEDGLKGYTSSTVNIRRNDYILTYDERGRQINSIPAR